MSRKNNVPACNTLHALQHVITLSMSFTYNVPAWNYPADVCRQNGMPGKIDSQRGLLLTIKGAVWINSACTCPITGIGHNHNTKLT